MDIDRKQVLEAMLCMTRQCWEQGMAAQAMLEIGEEQKLRWMVRDMVLRQSEDGRLCNVENTLAVTDSAFCIPAVYLLGIKEQNENYQRAASRNVRFLLESADHAEDGTLYHMFNKKEIWADSAAFLPYALALTGHVKEGIWQMEGICRRLYQTETGLYFHMWDEEKREFIRPLAWGIGNGWILTGLLRLYLVLEEKHRKEKEEIGLQFCNLLNTMLSYQTKHHLFRDILDNKDTFEESECSGMVAYAIYKAVAAGLLEQKYQTIADQIRIALYKKVMDSGLVTDSSSSPSFVSPGTAVESQAHFLLMEQAYCDIQSKGTIS